MRVSSRASKAPMQKWTPCPKDRWPAGAARSGSNVSGSGNRLPVPPLGQQVVDAVAEETDGGLEARHDQDLEHGRHLARAERGIPRVDRPDELAGQVGSGLPVAPLGEIEDVPMQGHDALGARDLLLGRQLDREQGHEVVRPSSQAGEIGLGQVQQAPDHQDRERVGEPRHEVRAAPRLEPIDQPVAQAPDARLQRGDAPGRQGRVDGAAETGVLGGSTLSITFSMIGVEARIARTSGV